MLLQERMLRGNSIPDTGNQTKCCMSDNLILYITMESTWRKEGITTTGPDRKKVLWMHKKDQGREH